MREITRAKSSKDAFDKAEGDIERAVGEGESRGIALVPIDLRPPAPRDAGHRLVEVQPDDAAVAALHVGHGARYDPGAGADYVWFMW